MGSQGFKMNINTSKLTQKDAGEYLIQTAISLKDNNFKTESQSFKLVITVYEKDSEDSEDTEGSEDSEDTDDTEGTEDNEETESDSTSDS